MTGRTLYSVLEQTAGQFAAAPALYQPYREGSRRAYRVYSWAEYLRAVQEICAGLRSLGIRKGDVVGLNSETRAEFYLADVGVMANGSLAAALYTTYPAADRVGTLRACGARAVFIEDAAALARLREGGGDSLDVRWVVLVGQADGAMTLDELRRRGREAILLHPELLPGIQAEIDPEDYAILYLTSGATGEPKMALVTHRALVANIDMGPPVLDLGPVDSMLAFLPSAHITQRVVLELLPLRCGVPVWFSESLMQLPDELATVKPTLFVAPPRLWDRVHTSIRAEVRKHPQFVQRLFQHALDVGLEAARLRQENRSLPLWLRARLAVADRLFFSRMRARFGGRMRVCGSGSAPLGKDLAAFYLAIGLPLVEGYGLTEGGVVTLNPLDRPKAGSIGTPLPGIEVRLSEEGELLVRGETLFSEYFRDPETTAQVLRDGWLHTGDLAETDAEGYLYITGRTKELIVSSTGRKVYPSRIESLIRLEPVISHVLPVGDGLPYVTALLTVNTDVAGNLPGMEAFRGRPASEIALAPPVLGEVQRAIARVNRRLAPFEQIRKYRVLGRDFSIEAGELTATMKVRRSRALANFHEDVAALYAKME